MSGFKDFFLMFIDDMKSHQKTIAEKLDSFRKSPKGRRLEASLKDSSARAQSWGKERWNDVKFYPWKSRANEIQTELTPYAKKFRGKAVKFYALAKRNPIVVALCAFFVASLFFSSGKPKSADVQTVVEKSQSVETTPLVKDSPRASSASKKVPQKSTSTEFVQNAREKTSQTSNTVFGKEPEPEKSVLDGDKKEKQEFPPVAEKQETPEEKVKRLLSICYDPSKDPKEREEADEELSKMRDDEKTAKLVVDAESNFIVKKSNKAESLNDTTVECSTDSQVRALDSRSITKLVLKGSQLTSRGLAQLNMTPNLQELTLIDLDPKKIKDVYYNYVGRRTSLTSLKTINCELGDEALEYIGKLSNLETLEVDWNIGSEALACIEKLSNLKKLDIRQANASLENLESFPFIKNIDVVVPPASLGVSLEGRMFIRNLKVNRTESVDLSSEPELDDVAFRALDPRSDLKSLNLSQTGITSECFEHIAKFKGLSKLNLSNTSIEDKDAKALNELLSELPLTSLFLEGCESFTEKGLALFSNGANLETLQLPDFPLDPEANYFKILKNPLLKEIARKGVLNLNGSQLDDSQLEQFASLEGITQISLSGCSHLECAPLVNFKSCSTIKSLDLSGVNVSDATLKNLTEKLPALKTLALKGCSVLTDESIRRIPSVENLDLRNVPKLTISGLLPHYRVNNLQYDDLYRRNELLGGLHNGTLTKISTYAGSSYEDLSAQDFAIITGDAKAQESVEFVDLADNAVPLEVLELLPKFKNLKKLFLVSCPTLQKAGKDEAKRALEHVASIKKLESLDVQDWNAPVEILEALLKCQNLSELIIPESFKTDVGFTYYYSIPRMKDRADVDLSSWHTTGKSIQYAVENLPYMESLVLNDQTVDSDLTPLVQSQTLKSLDMIFCSQVTKQGVFTALEIPDLSQINLPGKLNKYLPVIQEGFKTDFKSVVFEEASELTDDALEVFEAPRFKRSMEELVLLEAKHLRKNAPAHIANLTNLKILKLTNAREYVYPHGRGADVHAYGIFNDELQKLGALHNLEELDIEGLHPDDDDSGLNFVKQTPKLRVLKGVCFDSEQEIACVAGTSITDLHICFFYKKISNPSAIIRSISQMKNLESLFIEDIETHFLRSLSLAPLTNLPKLRRLFINGDWVDYSTLKDCKNLETLGCSVKVDYGKRDTLSVPGIRQISSIKSLKRLGVIYAACPGRPSARYDTWAAKDVAPLASLPNLEFFALGNVGYITESEDDVLYSFPKLKSFQVGKLRGDSLYANSLGDSKFDVTVEERGTGEVCETLDPEFNERPWSGRVREK